LTLDSPAGPGDAMNILPFTQHRIALFNTDALVPEVYASYRPLIRDAVAFFFERLPERRLHEIAAEVAELGPNALAVEQAQAAMLACPTLHKLGQVLARHQRLDPAFREQLRALESCVPSTPIDAIRGVLERELGPAMERFEIELGAAPLAEASVAVVVPCTWKPSRRAKRRHAVLKVLRPGIASKLHEELDILAELANFMDHRREAYDLPRFEFRQTLDSVRDLLAHEVLLEEEQRHLAEARERYENEPEILVPAVLPFSTPRVTAMERVFGQTLSDGASGREWPREGLGHLMVRVLLARTVFSRESAALFHADPHAGNMMLTNDGRLALLDWSLVGRLHKSTGENIVRLLMGALALDPNRMFRALEDLAELPSDTEPVRQILDESLRRIRRGRLPGLGWLTELFEDLAKLGVQFPAEMLLFQKCLFTIRGVVAELDPRCSLDRVFIETALVRLVREWPRRLWNAPWARNFSTHTSTLDLYRIYVGLPITLNRFWRQTLLDAFEAVRSR
jgi:ubiquinone biosynthesis protein